MRAYELLEKGFGIEGKNKQRLTQFISHTIRDTFAASDKRISSPSLMGSMSKRLVGVLIPDLFHLRNIINGKEKYFLSKFNKIMVPRIAGMIKAIHNDHPDETEFFSDPSFVDSFMSALLKAFVENKYQFIHSTSNI